MMSSVMQGMLCYLGKTCMVDAIFTIELRPNIRESSDMMLPLVVHTESGYHFADNIAVTPP